MNMYVMAVAILVPAIVFTFVASIIIIPRVLRSAERARMHETIRRLHESGEPMPPEMLDALRGAGVSGPTEILQSFNSPDAELRRGLILIAVAIAMVILGLVLDAGGRRYEPVWPIIGAAAFPGLIGVASLIMWRLSGKAK